MKQQRAALAKALGISDDLIQNFIEITKFLLSLAAGKEEPFNETSIHERIKALNETQLSNFMDGLDIANERFSETKKLVVTLLNGGKLFLAALPKKARPIEKEKYIKNFFDSLNTLSTILMGTHRYYLVQFSSFYLSNPIQSAEFLRQAWNYFLMAEEIASFYDKNNGKESRVSLLILSSFTTCFYVVVALAKLQSIHIDENIINELSKRLLRRIQLETTLIAKTRILENFIHLCIRSGYENIALNIMRKLIHFYKENVVERSSKNFNFAMLDFNEYLGFYFLLRSTADAVMAPYRSDEKRDDLLPLAEISFRTQCQELYFTADELFSKMVLIFEKLKSNPAELMNQKHLAAPSISVAVADVQKFFIEDVKRIHQQASLVNNFLAPAVDYFRTTGNFLDLPECIEEQRQRDTPEQTPLTALFSPLKIVLSMNINCSKELENFLLAFGIRKFKEFKLEQPRQEMIKRSVRIIDLFFRFVPIFKIMREHELKTHAKVLEDLQKQVLNSSENWASILLLEVEKEVKKSEERLKYREKTSPPLPVKSLGNLVKKPDLEHKEDGIIIAAEPLDLILGEIWKLWGKGDFEAAEEKFSVAYTMTNTTSDPLLRIRVLFAHCDMKFSQIESIKNTIDYLFKKMKLCVDLHDKDSQKKSTTEANKDIAKQAKKYRVFVLDYLKLMLEIGRIFFSIEKLLLQTDPKLPLWVDVLMIVSSILEDSKKRFSSLNVPVDDAKSVYLKWLNTCQSSLEPDLLLATELTEPEIFSGLITFDNLNNPRFITFFQNFFTSDREKTLFIDVVLKNKKDTSDTFGFINTIYALFLIFDISVVLPLNNFFSDSSKKELYQNALANLSSRDLKNSLLNHIQLSLVYLLSGMMLDAECARNISHPGTIRNINFVNFVAQYSKSLLDWVENNLKCDDTGLSLDDTRRLDAVCTYFQKNGENIVGTLWKQQFPKNPVTMQPQITPR